MGTRSNRLAEAVLTRNHNLCFEQKYKKYQIFFLFKNFQFLEVEFSIYSNRNVFLMTNRTPYGPRQAKKCPRTCAKFADSDPVHAQRVSSGPLFSIHTFCSIQ